MKISHFNMRDILLKLRNFTYTRNYNGEEETVNVELFPLNQIDSATKIYFQRYGNLSADDIMFDYEKDYISSQEIASILQTIYYAKWKQMLEIQFADYNPLWNVDGLEKRETTLTHGEKIKYSKGAESTSEQLVSGENTKEQITNGEDTSEQVNNATNEHKISPYDSTNYNPESKDESSMGKIKNVSNMGKIKDTFNNGKTKITTGGYDEDVHSGDDKTVDEYRRTGNIGVTMSTQLLRDGESFWSKFNFYDIFFKDINKELTIGIWE